MLFCGWLASRLGWEPGSMVARGDMLEGHARGKRQEVTLSPGVRPAETFPGWPA